MFYILSFLSYKYKQNNILGFKANQFVNNLNMKNFKISIILDIISTNILIFLISFVWLKFFLHSQIKSLIFCAFILLFFNAIYFYIKGRKLNKDKFAENLNSDINSYFLTLLSNSYQKNLVFFYDLYLKNKINVQKKDNYILINNKHFTDIKQHNNKTKILKNNFKNFKLKNLEINDFIKLSQNKKTTRYIIIPLVHIENLIFEDVLQAISPHITKCNNIIILCNNVDIKNKQKIENIANVNIKVMNKFDIFKNIFQKYNTYPKIIFTYKQNKKINFKAMFLSNLNKYNAKRYFFSGLFIFFCSFFVKYNLYYIIFSSIMFLLCFISLKNKQIS